MTKRSGHQARRRAEALTSLMDKGVGNPQGIRWTNEALSRASGLGYGTISVWKNHGVSGLPDNVALLRDALFPKGKRVAEYYREYEILFGSNVDFERSDVDTPAFTHRDVWNMLVRPIQANVHRIVSEAGDADGVAGLALKHLASTAATAEFIVPTPAWFADWAREPDSSGHAPYEVHEPMDFTGDPTLGDVKTQKHGEQMIAAISHHAELYARRVFAMHQDINVQFPPYNKKKIGVMGWRQPIRANDDERAYLTIHPYVTDYFTDRVMRGVLADMKRQRPALFEDIADYPMREGMNLAYFANSLGLNIVLVTDDKGDRNMHLTVLSRQIANFNQREKIHITANEAANIDDLDSKHSTINFEHWLTRSLLEELGLLYAPPVDELDPFTPNFLEFSFEMSNFEPFLSCVVYFPGSHEDLMLAMRSNARDARREISTLRSIPFDEASIMELLIKSPRGVEGFTTYSPLILDLIIQRRLTD